MHASDIHCTVVHLLAVGRRQAKVRENSESVKAAIDSIKSLDFFIADKDYNSVRCVTACMQDNSV
jgi:hypothetical protein